MADIDPAWKDKLWPVVAGLAAAAAYALYDEQTTRRRALVNFVFGGTLATFGGPAVCEALAVDSHNLMVGVSWLLGMFGAIATRWAIERAEKDPAGTLGRFVGHVLGRFTPPPQPNVNPEDPKE